MDETLIECEGNDIESKVPYTGLTMKKRLQHLFQIQLHDGAAHPWWNVPHFLQIFLLGQLLPYKNKKCCLNILHTFRYFMQKSPTKNTLSATAKIFTLSVCLLHPWVLLLKIGLEVFEDLDFEVDWGWAISQNTIVQGLDLLCKHLAGMHDHEEA